MQNKTDRETHVTKTQRTGALTFPGLHGLRGLLALWVVLSHTSGDGLGPIRIAKYGYLAVDFFFVMSGFILMNVHASDFRQLRRSAVSGFIALRFWRTFPVHILAISCGLVLSVTVYAFWPGLPAVLRGLVFFDTWYIPMTGQTLNPPMWSLRVEWLGYFCFPLLCHWLLKAKSQRLMAGVFVFIVGTETLLLVAGGHADLSVTTGAAAVIRMAGAFALGCLLFQAFSRPTPQQRLGDAALAGAVLGLAAVLKWTDAIYALTPIVLIIFLVAKPGPLTTAFLCAPTALFLGRISYRRLCHAFSNCRALQSCPA
jgi:peptidoglycan/LPS O-acetylase OafA/YrhL